MKALEAWFTRNAWVGHIPCALVLQAILAGLAEAGWAAAARPAPHTLIVAGAALVVAGHFWGWKVDEYQHKVQPDGLTGRVWWRGYTPVEWALRADTRPYVLQFVAPAVTVALSTLAAWRWL